MLLSDFIDEHDFASCLSEGVEDDGAGNGDEEEHVQ